MNRALVILGIALVVIGLCWPWLRHFPLGRLPGDINIHRDGFHFSFPLTTCILASAVVSFLLWLFRK